MTETAHRIVELVEVGHECQQSSQGEIAVGELPRPGADDRQHAAELDQIDQGGEERRGARERHLGREGPKRLAAKLRDRGVLPVVRLDE